MSLSAQRPAYVPILLPRDREAFAATGGWEAVLLSATYATNPRTRRLCDLARRQARTLLVDPKTAAYQFEGYMSMEDARAVPYSPGTGTLGSLWQPVDFATRAARDALVLGVFDTQRDLGADLYLAPYFLVPHAEHAWLEIGVETARQAIAAGADRPVGAAVCVELDGLLDGGAARIADAYAALEPALWMVVVVDHDERLASPEEMRAVLDLLRLLQRTDIPVLPAYCGRFGLAATVLGAAGYAGGGLELESHPRRYLREGLVNLRSNTYYLPGAMVRLPTRTAAAVATAQPRALGGDPADTRPARLVFRSRLQRALEAKRREIGEVADAGDPAAALRDRLDEALEVCRAARTQLESGTEELRRGEFHYLEVLREVCGGPAASRPADAGI